MQPGDNLGTFSSWSFHSGMKASFHLHLLCKSFRLLLWCMQIAAEATRLEKTKWKLNWWGQSELVTKIQDYNFFIRILGSLHGDCKKEGLSIWAEFDMLMRCLHTREVTQSQSNHPSSSQFFQVKTFTLAPFSSPKTIVCKCLQWFKVSKTEAFVLPANDVDCSHTQDVTATRALLIHGGARVHLVVGQAVLHCLGGLT